MAETIFARSHWIAPGYDLRDGMKQQARAAAATTRDGSRFLPSWEET